MKVKAPKGPVEDPKIKSAREAAERRADASFIEDTGVLLDEETRRRIRRFGNRATAARAGGNPGGGGRGGGGRGGGSVGGGAGGGTGFPGLDGRNPTGGMTSATAI